MLRFEHLLREKVEVRLLVATALVGLAGSVSFGALVRHRVLGGEQGGIVGELALAVASYPALVKQVLVDEEVNEHRAEPRFPGPGGFRSLGEHSSPIANTYLLVSRYDGDVGYNVTELRRSDGLETQLRWEFSEPADYSYARRNPTFQQDITSDPATMRASHAHLDAAAQLTFHFGVSPLYRVDAHGKRRWTNDDFAFHHSLELDADGNSWAPGRHLEPERVPDYGPGYFDDCIVKISPAGETVYWESVTAILERHGLRNLLYTYDKLVSDPPHLNDIAPV